MKDQEYDEAAAFWLKKDQTGKHMDEASLQKEVDAFLMSHKIVALATSGKDVRVTPLEYGYLDGALYIFSEGGEKFANLKVNKNVGAAIFDTDGSFGHLKSIQLTGKAEIVDLFSGEYVAAAKARHIPLDALKKLEEPMWLIKIMPSKIVFLNSEFKKQGFDSRQILDFKK